MSNTIYRVFALAMLSGIVLVSVKAIAAPVNWLPLESAEAERVAEPVFNGSMVVYEAGPRDAEPVVLIHGIGDGGARDWRSLIIDLAQEYHVIAVDLPGFGESSKGNHLYAPEQLALAVHKALAGRTDQSFSLIGHSLGAAVSMAYAHLYPDELRRLVIVDMPGVLHRAVYSRFLSNQGLGMLGSLSPAGSDWIAALLAKQLEQLELSGMNPAKLLYSPQARQNFMAGNPKIIAAYAAAEHNYTDALRDLRVPTLVLWGAEDPLTPLRTGQVVAGVVPGARLQVLPGAGHMPLQQTPKAFIAAVRAELSGRLEMLPAYALDLDKPTTQRSATCENEANQNYSGSIQKLTLINCTHTTIDGANIGELVIIGGDAHVINSHVFNGINARATQLRLTAGSVRGEPPMLLAAADVDAAGTRFISEFDVAHNRGDTPVSLWFSVASQQDETGSSSSLHEILSLPGGAVWP